MEPCIAGVRGSIHTTARQGSDHFRSSNCCSRARINHKAPALDDRTHVLRLGLPRIGLTEQFHHCFFSVLHFIFTCKGDFSKVMAAAGAPLS